MQELKSKKHGFQKITKLYANGLHESEVRQILAEYIDSYDKLEKDYKFLQEEAEKSKKRAYNLENSRNDAIDDIKKLKKENEELKALKDEKDKIEKEKVTYGAFQKWANEYFPNADDPKAEAQNFLEEKKRLEKENEELKGKNKELEDEKKKLEGKKEELEGENKKLEDEKKELEDKNKKLEDKKEELQDKLNKAIANVNIVIEKNVNEKTKEFTDQISELQKQNNSLRQQLEAARVNNNSYGNANNAGNNYNNYNSNNRSNNNSQQPNRQPPNFYDKELESLNKGEQDYFLRIYRNASCIEYERNIEYMDIVINYSDTVGFFASGNYKLAHVVLSTMTGIVIVNPYFFNIISEAHQYSEELSKLSSVFDYNIVPENYKNYQIIGIKPAKVRKYDDKFVLYQKGKVWFAEK